MPKRQPGKFNISVPVTPVIRQYVECEAARARRSMAGQIREMILQIMQAQSEAGRSERPAA